MRNTDDDAIAKDFTTGFDQIDLSDEVKEFIKKLNKHIFHLTKKRTTIDADKFNVGREGLEATKIIEAAIEAIRTLSLARISTLFQMHQDSATGGKSVAIICIVYRGCCGNCENRFDVKPATELGGARPHAQPAAAPP
jgi:hypothetical protein